MVLAATNRPEDLDEALRRRLEKRVYIPLPDPESRQQMFEINMKGIALCDDINYEELSKMCEGYSGADINNVCRDAAMMPLRRKLREGGSKPITLERVAEIRQDAEAPLTMDDFKEALSNIQKSVSQENLLHYQKWMDEFGCV